MLYHYFSCFILNFQQFFQGTPEMAPKYKLTYFPLTGLGEPIRWLLSYGNLEFEDDRFDENDWPKIKPTTPFGQVPILEIDGKRAWQSVAICRHLARQLNLAGKSDWDALQADTIVDCVVDLKNVLSDYYYEENEAIKAPKKEPIQKQIVPFYLGKFEKIVAENGGYFTGGQLTWADLYFISISEYLEKLAGLSFFNDYPNLKALREKVLQIPQIQAWIAKRPPS